MFLAQWPLHKAHWLQQGFGAQAPVHRIKHCSPCLSILPLRWLTPRLRLAHTFNPEEWTFLCLGWVFISKNWQRAGNPTPAKTISPLDWTVCAEHPPWVWLPSSPLFHLSSCAERRHPLPRLHAVLLLSAARCTSSVYASHVYMSPNMDYVQFACSEVWRFIL